jgi:phosphoribosyl 1,2-cyclic phosphate phosphodiesterase
MTELHDDSLIVTMLGCGGSAGVPTIGNYWGQCDPDNPKNRRSRPSILIQYRDTSVIVDTGPDFRRQYNRLEDTPEIDGIIYTHMHNDHTAGIDELRIFAKIWGRQVDIYANDKTMDDLRQRYPHVFQGYGTTFKEPSVNPSEIRPGELSIGEIDFHTFYQDHGYGLKTLGLRFGNMAYCNDVIHLDQHALSVLDGVETLIIDLGQNSDNSGRHLGPEKVKSYIDRIDPTTVYFTHMNQTLDYNWVMDQFDDHINPAFDGLIIIGNHE